MSNSFFSNFSVSMDTSSFSLADYASIKNGSYGKLLKTYYANEAKSETNQTADSKKKSTLVSGSASSAANSVKALMDKSLWEKKTTKVKDETTGKETEKTDYDRDSIKKALKSFIDDYNSTIEEAGESDNRNVLRNAAWMTKETKVHSGLLSEAGIKVGSNNKLELDEDALEEADISTLKSLFTGQNSYASKILNKTNTIAKAAISTGTYTKTGNYSDALSSLTSNRFDQKVGEDTSEKWLDDWTESRKTTKKTTTDHTSKAYTQAYKDSK